MKNKKWLLCWEILVACIYICVWIGHACCYAADSRTPVRKQEIQTCQAAAKDIFSWKKNETNAGEYLLSGENLENAADSDLDWYVLAMARMGCEDHYQAYANAMKQKIAAWYAREEKIDANQATIWHRLILTLLAMGEDPTKLVGTDGNVINLVADGIYDRGKTISLGEQGLNGYIWGLIALDSMQYAVPQGAYDTRDSILTAILAAQNEDGGFGLGGAVSDVDMTAMAVQALAPYDLYAKERKKEKDSPKTAQNEENISSVSAFDEVDAALYPRIEEAVEHALLFLQAHQQKNGAMGNEDEAVLESTAQTIVALSALKIDSKTEKTFIQNGKTLLDGLLSFQCADGSFRHLADEEEGNSLSSAQAAYALTAYVRVLYQANSLYDMRPEETRIGVFEQEGQKKQKPLAEYRQLEQKQQKKDKAKKVKILAAAGVILAAAVVFGFVGAKRKQEKNMRMEEEWNEQ